ncbi:hypothetical protein HPO96_29420 [Kribbella sandramycini]|uniref:Helix-turn-helix protein n=1 Tax=Kribbella sandramycini TaxID=60450 RepID=A0A7Y4P3P5_9ACTN|nr:hypothetical protein [Kribbella sandramycini]MBB6571731.1 hypothetical protein [Kribbella sandramycini]NOL44374.1 hypothetical protein [Kribbella sandramycini]
MTPDDSAFLTDLRRLKADTGLSYRQLERNAAKLGDTLPASTAATMLNRKTLPRKDLLRTYLRACGLTAPQQTPYLKTHTNLTTPTPAALPEPARPLRRPRLARRQLVLAAAALLIAFTTGTLSAVLPAEAVAEQESYAATPRLSRCGP